MTTERLTQDFQSKMSSNSKSPTAQGGRLLDGPLWPEGDSRPDWWIDAQKAAWKRFQEAPMPRRKDEDWRFANISALHLENFSLSSDPDASARKELLSLSRTGFDTAGLAVFANDSLMEHQAISQELAAQGVIWEPISAALEKHPELLRKHFMSQLVSLGSQKFAALHEAYCRNGMLVFVPKNVEVKLPLAAYHWLCGANAAVFPHTLILAEANSKVTVLDFLHSFSEEPGFACSVNDLILGPGAQVNYLCSQNWSEKVLSFQVNATSVERDASAKSLNVNLGGFFARVESKSQLNGDAARSEMLSLTVAHGTQEFDQRTLQNHVGRNTWSDLLYKNALLHRSKTIFKGLIQVEKGAAQTDAYQTNRNLLLDPEAEADSMPGLEILNDDVKCSHGATTGQIQEEELFYFLARGITSAQAKQLLVYGFLDEVLLRFGHEKVAAEVRTKIEAKFARSKTLDWKKTALPEKEEADETDVRALQG